MAVVYEHLRNDTNEVFYVGIGAEENRVFDKHNRSPYWKHIVNKVGYSVNIIHKDIDWEEAKNIEILLIEKYGRKDLGKGNLVNMTDGGEGSPGVIISEETRKKISEANKGRKGCMLGKTHSEEARKKISEANKGNTNMLGKTHSEETKKKMSEANTGKTYMLRKTPSEENRKKISEANTGKTHSEETKQKLSEAQKGENNNFFGKKHSEEARKKMSEANKGNTNMLGKTLSEETRKKMSITRQNKEGVKGYFFNKERKKYTVKISVMKKCIHIGHFNTPEEASQAYQQAKLIYHT